MQEARVILVVDDDESVRLLLSTLLERESYQVLLAKDGLQALEISRGYKGTIHGLVTDYKMPGMDGLQLATTLVSERPGIKVLIISGRMSNPEGLRRSGFPMLPKPFTITGLLTALKQSLQ